MLRVEPHSGGIVRQRRLSNFLHAELLHTLGSYRLAREGFEQLIDALGDPEKVRLSGSPFEQALLEACQRSEKCNRDLQEGLHDPNTPRHPSEELKEFAVDVQLLERIVEFYEVAARALEFDEESESESDLEEKTLRRRLANLASDREVAAAEADAQARREDPDRRLGRVLADVHDLQRRGRVKPAQRQARRRGRTLRMEAYRQRAVDLIEKLPAQAKASGVQRRQRLTAQRILEDDVQRDDSLHLTILQALVEAHRWMHVAEHLRCRSFGEMFTTIPKTYADTQRMLRYSHELNTFAFVAARMVPWAFAEDETERELVLGDYLVSCDRLTPTYCMWTATQFSLLALHRRAFTSWTMERYDRAYRDFYKLVRTLGRLREPAERRAVRVPGTKTFIEGLAGMSELHIGRIYRGQHAHQKALEYFKRASGRLEDWEEHEEIGPLVVNSFWRISLLMNQAKANYELGRMKLSLLHYAEAWRAFLRLADSESHATANIEVVEGVIEWLRSIAASADLSRSEAGRRMAPLVEQFETLRSPKHLELLAADIIMRVGHLLYMLKLPPADWDPQTSSKLLPPESDHDLAYRSVTSAARLDPSSTQAASDLLKIEADAPEDRRGPRPPAPIPLGDQWPAGSGRFEEAARIIEYTLHRWLADNQTAGKTPLDDTQVARTLIASFLAHADSSNVKLAQVYRYLMQGPRARQRRTDADQCTLDFVCLRRYSSFFPFLPRPSAFRASGGGYFVQVREAGEGEEPFGIAIDPGPDFIENLYRCGYALSDLHMILLTHDHADHIASVDALLALMGIRAGLGDDRFDPKRGRLAIVGNESVVRRYRYFDPPPDSPDPPPDDRDAVSILDFEEIARITALGRRARRRDKVGGRLLEMPPTLRIEPVRSWGHKDAARRVSQGFLLSMGEPRSTILFTSDSGEPPGLKPGEKPDSRHASGELDIFEAAAQADVVVAHLSAVPLPELRELAGMSSAARKPDPLPEFRRLWTEARRQAERTPMDEDLERGVEEAGFLLRQLQFGFRIRHKEGRPELGVSPFSDTKDIKSQPEKHLYLRGLLGIARRMRKGHERREAGELGRDRPPPLLLIGELREELGTFRTRIARNISEAIFRREASEAHPSALTADIGLRVRIARSAAANTPEEEARAITVLCTTCDLDSDLIPHERFHRPHEIAEVCVKGEDEGVFYNCPFHDPRRQPENLWVETVERYDAFGE
jgi:tetratricopeptide (TPR) repeat protein